MNLRILFPSLLCLLFASALLSAQPPQVAAPGSSKPDPATISLTTNRDPAATMNGRWRFHTGDSPDYASPTFDDSQWPLLKTNQDWFDQGYKGYSGYAWYRFRIILPPGPGAYDLELPSIRTSIQVFLDGRLDRTVGSMGTDRLYNMPTQIVPLPSPSPTSPTTVAVAIRVWHPASWANYYGGGPTSTRRVGTRKLIEEGVALRSARLHYTAMDSVVLGVISLLCGLASLAIFFIHRSAREYLWFAVFCLSYATGDAAQYLRLGILGDIALVDTTNVCVGLLTSLSLIFLLRQIFDRRLSLLYWIAVSASLLNFLKVVGLEWFHFFSIGVSNSVGDISGVMLHLALISIVARHAIKRNRDAQLLLLPFFLRGLDQFVVGFLWTSRTLGHPLSWSLNNLNLSYPFPISPSDIVDLVFFLGFLAVLLNRFARTSREQDRLAADLESARTLQQILIPEIIPAIPGVTIHTAYHPAQQVGGDFFQIIPVPAVLGSAAATLIILGDVSGKGLPAAMTVSVLVGAIRTLAEFTQSPAEILAGLNRRLIGRGTGFTTCLALHLTPAGLLTFANAGHLSPYLNGAELETPPALPLGLDPDATFAEQTLQLSSNDHLTLITDGVLEAATPTGELFGFTRTQAASPQSAPAIADLARTHGQNDDITVLTLDFV